MKKIARLLTLALVNPSMLIGKCNGTVVVEKETYSYCSSMSDSKGIDNEM